MKARSYHYTFTNILFRLIKQIMANSLLWDPLDFPGNRKDISLGEFYMRYMGIKLSLRLYLNLSKSIIFIQYYPEDVHLLNVSFPKRASRNEVINRWHPVVPCNFNHSVSRRSKNLHLLRWKQKCFYLTMLDIDKDYL